MAPTRVGSSVAHMEDGVSAAPSDEGTVEYIKREAVQGEHNCLWLTFYLKNNAGMVPTEPNNLAAPAEHDCLAASTESEKTLQQLCNAAHCSQSRMLLLSFLFSLVVIIFLIHRTFFFALYTWGWEWHWGPRVSEWRRSAFSWLYNWWSWEYQWQ